MVTQMRGKDGWCGGDARSLGLAKCAVPSSERPIIWYIRFPFLEFSANRVSLLEGTAEWQSSGDTVQKSWVEAGYTIMASRVANIALTGWSVCTCFSLFSYAPDLFLPNEWLADKS